jgi:hypothetical protein
MAVRWISRPLLFRSALLLAAFIAASAESVSIRLEGGGFRVAGWTPPSVPPPGGWESLLAVYAGSGDVPRVMGSYGVENGSLFFRPRFPIGVAARAVFRVPGGTAIETILKPAHPEAGASAKVERIFPSSGVLPENQLKLYVHFSAPMSRGVAWEHLRLLDDNGGPVDLPFLELDQELWDREHRRLTVLFDPGRIKRGVLPRDEVGAALETGRTYTLVVDKSWPDANGRPMGEEARKQFRVAPEERSPIDPAHWRISTPRPATRDPLVIDFGRSLDYALAMRAFRIPTLAGDVSVEHEETRWVFVPEHPWKAGAYEIVVDTALEDLAGNRIGRAFDVDVFERVTQRVLKKTISLPLRVGSE